MIPYLLELLERAVCRLEWKTAQRIGGFLGLVWYTLVPVRRRTVMKNLALAMPDVTAKERRRIARDHYLHLGKSALEFLWLAGRGMQKSDVIAEENGIEHYHGCLEEGGGVMVVTGHFGNWDLVACMQAAKGVPLHVVTKDLSQRGFNSYWMGRREKAGIRFHPDRGSLKSIIRALKSNEVVGLVIDQRTPAEQGGIKADFMGQDAWTSTTAAVLALRTGARLLPAYGYRRDDGLHAMEIGPPVDTSAYEDYSKEAVATLTQHLNDDLAKRIRQHPEQWLWLHRRWADT